MARDLGLNRSYQAFAAFLAAFLPMALFQASSTQNDLVVQQGAISMLIGRRPA